MRFYEFIVENIDIEFNKLDLKKLYLIIFKDYDYLYNVCTDNNIPTITDELRKLGIYHDFDHQVEQFDTDIEIVNFLLTNVDFKQKFLYSVKTVCSNLIKFMNPNLKYKRWLTKHISDIISFKFVEEIHNGLPLYIEAAIKKQLLPEEQDILKLTLGQFLRACDRLAKLNTKITPVVVDEGNYKLIYDGPDCIIIVPKDFETSIRYGSPAWCTTWLPGTYFERYSNQDSLYMIFPKNPSHTSRISKDGKNYNISERYQFHFPSKQFFHEKDGPAVLTDMFKKYPGVSKTFINMFCWIQPENIYLFPDDEAEKYVRIQESKLKDHRKPLSQGTDPKVKIYIVDSEFVKITDVISHFDHENKPPIGEPYGKHGSYFLAYVTYNKVGFFKPLKIDDGYTFPNTYNIKEIDYINQLKEIYEKNVRYDEDDGDVYILHTPEYEKVLEDWDKFVTTPAHENEIKI